MIICKKHGLLGTHDMIENMKQLIENNTNVEEKWQKPWHHDLQSEQRKQKPRHDDQQLIPSKKQGLLGTRTHTHTQTLTHAHTHTHTHTHARTHAHETGATAARSALSLCLFLISLSLSLCIFPIIYPCQSGTFPVRGNAMNRGVHLQKCIIYKLIVVHA